MPKEFVPKTRKEFRDFDIMEEFGENLYNKSTEWIIRHLSRNGNPWRLIDRMRKTRGRDVMDAVKFLALKLVVPAILNKIRNNMNHGGTIWQKRIPFTYMEDGAHKFILSNFTLGNLLELSERYHCNIARYEDCFNTVSDQQAWTGILGTLELGNGYTARELTSVLALKIQGRMENHCVGGYSSTILSANMNEIILIFSIERNNRILSTVDIVCSVKNSGSKGYRLSKKEDHHDLIALVRQEKAYNNTVPCRTAQIMADRVVGEIQKIKPDSWQTYLDEVQQMRDPLDLDPYVAGCGFNPWNRTRFETVWTELFPVLPRFIRKTGLDALIRHDELNIQLTDFQLSKIFRFGNRFTGLEFENPWDQIDANGKYLSLKTGVSIRKL